MIHYKEIEDHGVQFVYWQLAEEDDGDPRNQVIADQRKTLAYQDAFINWCLRLMDIHGIRANFDEVVVL